MEGYREKARQIAGRSLVVGISALTSAGSKVARAAAAGVGALTATDREKITALKFAYLDAAGLVPVLLLAYETGFQVWSLEGPGEPTELVSKRDGHVRLIDLLPAPDASMVARGPAPGRSPLTGTHPLLVLARGGPPADPDHAPAAMSFYSLRTHAIVESVSLAAPPLAFATSTSLLVVSLPGQLAAYDAHTLSQRFTCLVYTSPTRSLLSVEESATTPLTCSGVVPCALGAAWLAYPSPQAVPKASGGTAKARCPMKGKGGTGAVESGGSGSHGAPSGSSSRARDLVQRGGASLASAGGMGLKYLSEQVSAWRGRGGGASGLGGGSSLSSGAVPNNNGTGLAASEIAGTVLVRDTSTRRVVAMWKAHGSPLAAMAFDPSGALLATASVSGRSVRVWRLSPIVASENTTNDTCSSQASSILQQLARVDCVAVFYRGMTPAVIQGLSFSCDSAWLAAVSGRGTAHVFRVLKKGRSNPPIATLGDEQQEGGEFTTFSGAAAPSSTIASPSSARAYGRARRPGILRGGGVVAAASGAKRVLQRGENTPSSSEHASKGGHTSDRDILPCVVTWRGSSVISRSSSGTATMNTGTTSSSLQNSLLAAAADGLFMTFDNVGGCTGMGEPRSGSDEDDVDEYGGASRDMGSVSEKGNNVTTNSQETTLTLQDSARWDVGRRYGWQEREEELGSLPGSPATVEVLENEEDEQRAVAQQQKWLAESQSVWDYLSEPPLASRANITLIPSDSTVQS